MLCSSAKNNNKDSRQECARDAVRRAAMVEAAGVARLREYTWAIPPAHSRANFTPRGIRKFTGGLVKLIRSHDVLRTEGVRQWVAELEWLPATPTAPVWDDVNKWLIERGHRYSVDLLLSC